jgi:hypothetical protein
MNCLRIQSRIANTPLWTNHGQVLSLSPTARNCNQMLCNCNCRVDNKIHDPSEMTSHCIYSFTEARLETVFTCSFGINHRVFKFEKVDVDYFYLYIVEIHQKVVSSWKRITMDVKFNYSSLEGMHSCNLILMPKCDSWRNMPKVGFLCIVHVGIQVDLMHWMVLTVNFYVKVTHDAVIFPGSYRSGDAINDIGLLNWGIVFVLTYRVCYSSRVLGANNIQAICMMSWWIIIPLIIVCHN